MDTGRQQTGVCHACGKEGKVYFSDDLPYCKDCIKIYGGDGQ